MTQLSDAFRFCAFAQPLGSRVYVRGRLLLTSMLLFSAPSGRVSQEKKPKSKVVANAEAKAKRSLLNTVHTGLTNKALGALTDVSSKVLSPPCGRPMTRLEPS
jgi:hypothetical protein